MLLRVVFIATHILVSSSHDVVTIDGDVMMAGLFNIQNGQDSACSDTVSTISIQEYQAVRWVIQQLNQRQFIPNVTIGFKAYKTCGQSTLAVERTTEMLRSPADNSTNDVIYGIIGPGRSSETQVVSRFLSSLPSNDRILQISVSATAVALSDRAIYRNLYRVIESDIVQVEVIIQLLLHLKWNYVAIGYENDIYGTDGAQALKEKARVHDICIPIFERIHNLSNIVLLREKLDIQSSPVSGMVFFGSGQMAKMILEYLDQHLNVPHFQLIITEALALESMFLKDGNSNVYDRARGLLTPTPVYAPVSDFSSYWNSLFENHTLFREEAEVNPWISLYFESMTGCKLLPGTDITDCWEKSLKTYAMTQQPLFIPYAILGAAVMAQVFKNIQSDVCKGVSGVCDAMKNLDKNRFIQEMETLTVTPKDLIDDLFPSITNISFKGGKLEAQQAKDIYEVYNYRKGEKNQFGFQKVGTYSGTSLVIHGDIRSYDKSGHESDSVSGQCHVGYQCSECLPDPAHQVIHIPGDFYVIGLVPIHNKHIVTNDQSSYFKYGTPRDSVSVDIAEGMIHSIQTINSKAGRYASVLRDKTIGLIVLDTSNNPLIVNDKIVSLHKGELDLGGGVMSSQILDKIIGYAGPVASSISIPLSPTMKQLNQLFIAYASTSVKLSDRDDHPTFMRTTAALDNQVEPMMRVVKAIGATYIQILYTDESYGRSGMEEVMSGAVDAGVCVAQAIPVKEDVAAGEYVGIVNELRRFRYAKMVIVFSRSHTSPVLMKMINNEIKLGEFIFFGSGEGWAKRLNVISGNRNLRGSFTMAQEIPVDQEFEKYFHNISSNSPHNPWLKNYLEENAGCFFPESFVKKSSDPAKPLKLCTADISSQLQIDTWVPFAANAVYALVLGFNKTLADVCNRVIGKCADYSTDELIRHTKDVLLDVYRDGNVRRVFDSDGNGASGFKITQIVQTHGSEDLTYRDVGSAAGDQFKFDLSLLDNSVTYTSACPTEYECEICKSPVEPKSTVNVPLVAVVVIEAVVIVVLLVAIMVICVRHKRSVKDHYDEIDHRKPNNSCSHSVRENPNYTYLTPVRETDSAGNDNDGFSTSDRSIELQNASVGLENTSSTPTGRIISSI